MKRSDLLVFFLILMLFCGGCAHYPINAGPALVDKDKGYRYENIASADNSDSLYIILAFSGGGTRAAALSYGVLEMLKKTEIVWEGKKKSLLDEVDVISSVSGGSFTSAYYALYGEGIFKDFESVFLKKNIQGDLAGELFNPGNWFRLASPLYNRIDMAADYYDRNIFGGKTFKDMLKRKPFVLINATDMSLGGRFEFTQDQFDPLCSDIADFHVSRAVAASSAFPVLLSPVTVRNYAGQCPYQEPTWMKNALAGRDVTSSRFARAEQLHSYLDGGKRPFIHLMDGGVADNIGLREPIYSLTSTDCPWSLLRKINMRQVKKVAIVVVNAKTEADQTIDQKEKAPGLETTLMTVANVPMANFSFETVDLLKRQIDQWQQDDAARKSCEDAIRKTCPNAGLPGVSPQPVDFYPIVISFDAIKDDAERSFFKNLPTNFYLPPESIDRIRGIAAGLLEGSPEFQRLKRLSE